MNHYTHYTKKQKNHQTRIQKIYYIYIYESSNPYCTKEEEEEGEKKKKHQQQQRRRRRCSGEEEEPVATAGRRRKSRTAAAVAVKKKQSSSSGSNMAERGVRGDIFDLRPTSKKKFVSVWVLPWYHPICISGSGSGRRVYSCLQRAMNFPQYMTETLPLFPQYLPSLFDWKLWTQSERIKRTSETFPLFPQYMPSLVDSLKEWEWTQWKRKVVGCLCEYDHLPSHMC